MLMSVWIILLSTTYGMYNQGAYLGPTLMTKLDKDFKVQKIGHNDVQKLKNEGLSTLINNGEIDVHCDRAGPRKARFSLWVGERDIHNLCDRHQMTSYNPHYSPNYGPYQTHQPYRYDQPPLVPEYPYSAWFQPGQYQQGAPQIPAAVGVAAQPDPNQQATTAMFQAATHAEMNPVKAHKLMMQAQQAAYHANQERTRDFGAAAQIDPKAQEMNPVLAMQQRNQELEAEILRLREMEGINQKAHLQAMDACETAKSKLESDIQMIRSMVNGAESSELQTQLDIYLKQLQSGHFATMVREMPDEREREREKEAQLRAHMDDMQRRSEHAEAMAHQNGQMDRGSTDVTQHTQ